MEPKGWREWKEVPYRGQPESKSYRSNRKIKFSKLEKWVNIGSVIAFASLSFIAIFFTIRNFQNGNTENIFALIILSVTTVMFTIAVSQGVLSTILRKRIHSGKKNRDILKEDSKHLDQ
jgi:hypothetical protein